MVCPQCGTTDNGELKFCKKCGVNLQAVRQAIATREPNEKPGEKNDWIANLMLLPDEIKRRKREQQNTFEVEEKRYNEIKAGVITTCVGLALMIFLGIFMAAIAETVPTEKAATIIRHIWIAGIIPFFIGLGLTFNGVVVSKRLVDLARREFQQRETARNLELEGKERANVALSAADSYEFDVSRPSVTEHTTRQLKDSN
jgi:hypothetical protein